MCQWRAPPGAVVPGGSAHETVARVSVSVNGAHMPSHARNAAILFGLLGLLVALSAAIAKPAAGVARAGWRLSSPTERDATQ